MVLHTRDELRGCQPGEIANDPHVALLYFDASGLEYASIQGVATVVTDRAERARHWKPEWAPFYKKGVDDPAFLLLRVRPTRAEVVSPRHKLMNDPATWRPVGVSLP